MDEDRRQLDGIRERESLIGEDATTPLHLIREKELELSGRVLKSREAAGEIVASARRQAAEIVARAETDADTQARAWEEKRAGEARTEADEVRSSVGESVAEVQVRFEKNRAAAVDAVVERVTRI